MEVLAEGLTRAPMDEREVPFVGLQPLRLADQVGPRLFAPVGAGPLGGDAGVGSESLDRLAAARSVVVVALDADGPDSAQALHHAVGLGAIANHVADVPHGVDGPEGAQYRVQGHEIGVNVR